MNDSFVDPGLTATNTCGRAFADGRPSVSIALGNDQTSQGVIYQMTDEATGGKSLGQTYHEEVEALKSQGTSNAEAIRQVAEKYMKTENTVRGGIHQYRSRHLNGSGATAPRSRARRSTAQSVDDYLANARQALEAALMLIDQEVEQAKAALDEAQSHYDEVQASVKDRKADIEKKLKALA